MTEPDDDIVVTFTRQDANDEVGHDLGRPLTDEEWRQLRPKIEYCMIESVSYELNDFMYEHDRTDLVKLSADDFVAD